MANIYSDIKGKVTKYEPLIRVNREFLALSQSITENAPSPRLKSKHITLLLFTRAATIFEAIQLLCERLKTIERFILLRSLFEVNAYVHYIWAGGQASQTEREKRAELYGSWEFVEDKKILDMIKQNKNNFFATITQDFQQKENSINQNYQQLLQKFPELQNKNRRKGGWHGSTNLQAGSCMQTRVDIIAPHQILSSKVGDSGPVRPPCSPRGPAHQRGHVGTWPWVT